ncbi:MAG: hypothetical protein PQJ59_10085 [Spirochaetales bacterium]|nr:hypothetical protein [Spirochaetales bacterium]
MRKQIVLTLLCIVTAHVFGSSIDYRGNQSVDYIRTLTRGGSLDAADIVIYNPAGTAMMEDGFHINFGNQFIFKNYSMELDATGTEYVSDVPTLILPNLFGVYKRNNWAGFVGAGITAGGGTVEYEDGIAYTAASGYTDCVLEATSIYYGVILGGSYAVNDMFSFSLAGRYITSEKDIFLEGDVGFGVMDLLEVSQSATGFGAIIGLDIRPMDALNIGIKYETETALEYENDTTTDNVGGYTDESTFDYNLPALLSVGVAFDMTQELKINAGLVYYFIEMAEGDAYEDYDNGFDLSTGVEYRLIEPLVLSVGYMYSKMGSNSDTISDFDMSLDSHNIAAGVKYDINENIDAILAYNYSTYPDLSNSYATYDKTTHLVAAGVNLKF